MIANQFDVFVLDLDGVVYLGDDPLPDAVESVSRLKEMDKEIRFLTNDPRPTRQAVVNNLQAMGIDVRLEEVVTAGWATAQYLAECGVGSAAVVGSEGLTAELEAVGLDVTDDDPEAVVVGAAETTDYLDIQRATRHVDRGATFVGTNPDGSFPTPDGPAPGAGAIVRAVEAATGTAPTVVGKPEPLMFDIALGSLSSAMEAVVVGDNPATDILGAHRSGLTWILVAEDDSRTSTGRDFIEPETTISTLADLFSKTTETGRAPPYPWPDEIRPGVGAVVLNECGEVLLLKRADRGQWALPTGTVERCESVRDALVREMNEETGLNVEIEHLSGVYSAPEEQVFQYPSGRCVHFITNCFLCSSDGGTPVPDEEEVTDVGFFEQQSLPTNVLPIHPQWIEDATAGDGTPNVR